MTFLVGNFFSFKTKKLVIKPLIPAMLICTLWIWLCTIYTMTTLFKFFCCLQISSKKMFKISHLYISYRNVRKQFV